MEKIYKVKRNNTYIFRNIGGEIKVLAPHNGNFFNLNETGSRLWAYLWKSRSEDELVRFIQKKYKLPSSNAKKDVASFLRKSLKEKILLKIII